MAPKTDVTAPLPFFYHAASERVLYVAHGPSPSPLIFSIALRDVLRHEPICRGPVQTNETHPFGTSTGVSSLVEEPVRRGLGEAEALDELGVLEDILLLWRDFCDAVAERLQHGEDLEPALAKAFVLENAHDIDMSDLHANSAGEPHGGAA
ncbi:MAG TPA: hypothetical protein VGB85_24515 [Nannocystis sp.]|jgi:hypothetical protein